MQTKARRILLVMKTMETVMSSVVARTMARRKTPLMRAKMVERRKMPVNTPPRVPLCAARLNVGGGIDVGRAEEQMALSCRGAERSQWPR